MHPTKKNMIAIYPLDIIVTELIIKFDFSTKNRTIYEKAI